MKRRHDGAEKWPQVKGHHAFKALCPDNLVAVLLGAKGVVKDQIQLDTGTRLVFSNRGDCYPGTEFRVMAIYSDDAAAIGRVFDWIIPKLVECGDEERERPNPNSWSASAQPELLGKEPGEYVFRFCVPRRTSGALIGPQGSHIKTLRNETNAKVFVENESQCDHQMVRVIANPDNMITCLRRINEVLQAESEADYYREWAQVVNFSGITQDNPGFDAKGRHSAGKGGSDGGSMYGGSDVNSQPLGGKGAPRSGSWPSTGPGGPQPVAPAGAFPVSTPSFPASAPSRQTDQGGSSVQELVDRVQCAVASLPQGTAQMRYSISCELATDQVKQMSGPNGEYFRNVERSTGAEITAAAGSDGTSQETQTISIVGPLLHTYTAHLMLMKRFREVDAVPPPDLAHRGREGGSEAAPNAESTEQLQAQIAELQAKLKAQELQNQISELNAKIAEAEKNQFRSEMTKGGGSWAGGKGGKKNSIGGKGAW